MALGNAERAELVGWLGRLTAADLGLLVAALPEGARQVSRQGTVPEQVAELLRWAESVPDVGLEGVREAARRVGLAVPGSAGAGARRGVVGLPAKPNCFGREDLIEQLVGALLEEEGRPVAVLGGPGMGKSTLVLAALHDKRVQERFGERRFFVRCDAATSRDGVVLEIGRVIGLEAGEGLEGRVLGALGERPAVLVLDNLETPWEADRAGTEELLAKVAGVPGLVLVGTLRGAQRPAGVAWRDALPVGALELAAARQAFLAVAGSGLAADPDLDGLLGAVDCVPLAVVLLAYQAEGQPRLAPLLKQWRAKKAEVLKRPGAEDRLGNLGVSLELSIGGLRMKGEGRRLLSVLGVLPDGVAWEDLEAVLPGVGEEGAKVLRQVGLAFDETERVPVREYVREHYSPWAEDGNRVVAHYIAMGWCDGGKAGRQGGGEAVGLLTEEVGNVEAMILRGLDGPAAVVAVKAACGFVEFQRFAGLGSEQVLVKARQTARAMSQHGWEAECVFKLGDLALNRSDHAGARARYEEALALFQGVGSVLGQAYCFKGLGDIALRCSDHAEARARYEEALPLFQGVGDVIGQANCILSLGDIALRRSEHEQARARYEEALPLFGRVKGYPGSSASRKL